MRYLDALGLAKLKNLRLGMRRYRAEGQWAGRHQSVHQGFSQEFAQHREYAPGDELKYLDWKVYARKDRFFVRQFQEDKSLQTYLLVDASGSMIYQSPGLAPKWEYACRLAEAMGYLVLEQGDAAGLVTFDTAPGVFLAPRRSVTHLELMDAALERTRPRGETDLSEVLRQVAGRISRRSLIVLISDLLGAPERVLEVIGTLRARKHEVFVLQTLDPEERDLSLDGPIKFESLENDSWLRCDASLVREAYREEFERQQRLYEAGLRKSATPYSPLYTDVPWDQALAQFLASHGLL